MFFLVFIGFFKSHRFFFFLSLIIYSEPVGFTISVSVWIDSTAAPLSSISFIVDHLDSWHCIYWWSAVKTGKPILNLRFIFVGEYNGVSISEAETLNRLSDVVFQCLKCQNSWLFPPLRLTVLFSKTHPCVEVLNNFWFSYPTGVVPLSFLI